MHRALHDQPRAREADLAGVVELVHRLLHDGVEVGVGERDERRLAAELERDRREVRRRRPARRACPSGTQPVNAMRSTPGWAVRAAPASSPMPCTTLNAPSGRPASCAMSASIDAVSGAHSGGFRIDGVAGRERGRHPPGREHQRRVPRGDHDRDAARIPGHALGEPVVVLRAGLEREQLVGEEPEVARDPRHHRVPHRAQQRPVVAGLDRRELGHPRLDPVGDAVQHLGAFLRRHRAPGLARRTRGGDRSVDLVGAAPRDLGDRLLVDRRDVGERAARRRRARPPIQCSVETSMPSTTARLVVLPSPVSEEPRKVVRVRTVWGAAEPVKPALVRVGGNRRAGRDRRSSQVVGAASTRKGLVMARIRHPARRSAIVLARRRRSSWPVRSAPRSRAEDWSRRTARSTSCAPRRSPRTTRASSTTSRRSSSPARAEEVGSIIPLPGVPTKVVKGGDWTLQRLLIETQPPAPESALPRRRPPRRRPRCCSRPRSTPSTSRC